MNVSGKKESGKVAVRCAAICSGSAACVASVSCHAGIESSNNCAFTSTSKGVAAGE